MFLAAAALTFALTAPEQAAAQHFARDLTSDRIRTFIPDVADPDDLAVDPFVSVRVFLGTYRCITVRSWRAWREDQWLVVGVDGEGELRNARHPIRPIPAIWYLRINDVGAIVFAESEADHAAEALAVAKNDDERRQLIHRYDSIVHELASSIALSAVRSDGMHWSPAAQFLLEWSWRNDDPVTETYAWAALARMASGKRQWDEAVYLAEGARTASQRVDSCDLAAFADFVSATVSDESDLDRRRTLLDPVVAEGDSLEEPLALRSLNALAGDAFYVGDFGRAFRYLQTLRDLSVSYDWPVGQLLATQGIARVKSAVNDEGAALESEKRTFTLAHEFMNREYEARSCNVIGTIVRRWPDHNEARAVPWFRRALAAVPKTVDVADTYEVNLGNALLNSGRADEVEPLLQSALKRHTGFYVNALMLGEKLRRAQGRYAEAVTFARNGIARGPQSLFVVWELQADLGNLLIECGEVDDGIDALRQSIDLIEARRALSTSDALIRAGYFATRQWVYASLLSALLNQHRFEEALAVAERMKARSLDDVYSVGNPKLAVSADEAKTRRALNQRIIDLNRTIVTSPSKDAVAAARKQLLSARADLATFTSELALRHSTWSASSDPAWAGVSAPRHGTPVVEYAVLADSVVAFVVRDGTVYGRRLPLGREEIEQRTKRYLQAIEKRDLNYKADARRLYDAIVAPIASLIPRSGPLDVVPDDFLWRIPFEALRTPSQKFVAEQHAIAYAPSMTMLQLAQIRRPTTAKATLLALGNPTIAGSTSRKASELRGLSLDPLPDAAREVRALASLYGPEQSTVLTGAAATETTLKNMIGNYRIVHLAAHGFVDDASPLYSAVVLAAAPADPDDGLLEMREISDLRLHADLVVLSSCDTARGELYAGEGVIGMSWALLSAGCPTAVVSQWKATSRATSKLMIEFHRRLLAGDSKAEALRKARLVLMKDAAYGHPFYWAPFVIVGEGSSKL